MKGEQEQAEAMLKNNPALILEKGRVTDYSGRTIEGTALQMALGAEDVGIQENEECMVEMIERYLKKLPNGEAIILEQQAAQFPKDYKAEEEKRNAEDIAALNKVIKVISAAKNDEKLEETCKDALEEFRKYLQSKTKEVITTGKHFNVQMLVEAFNLYDKNYESFGKDFAGDCWDSPKNILCWRKVIGYIQRYLPACYAQAFAQGLYYILDKKEPLRRSLEFRSDKGIFFFPIDPNLLTGLGYDYASWGGWGAMRGGTGWVVAWGMWGELREVARLAKLMSSKNVRGCENLCGAQTVLRVGV